MTGGVKAFIPAVQAWFAQEFGAPTPPQREAWPAIQRGENTLILAPTGSGKTLAAFLWGIDSLLRAGDARPGRPERGVRLLYVSPLKALNNDIQRNLRAPLRGIRETAAGLGTELPPVRVAVRSGDTPARERRAAVKDPPDILITTPESLYLLLTSPAARETLRSVETVIVDEVHTLVGEKRGVHLALSLERLELITARSPQRIGCSATIRPLEEAARFLGGAEWPETAAPLSGACPTPRPVTIVDTGYRKALDLQVETVVPDFRRLDVGSVWPAVIGRVTSLVREHDTTLVFANSRRLAERTADRLTESLYGPADRGRGEDAPGAALVEGGVATGVGMFAAGTGVHPHPIRAHHGSMSRESRLRMEAELKSGALPALVGTSSLELGIDIGSVDLVVQLQSPKGVAQGLQRVGRSGHLVGQTSKGRIFTTHVEDVLEAAVIAGEMLRGEVESTVAPRNCLDVLAQQVVAMVAVEEWCVDDLYRAVRCSYPYADLTPLAFRSVLDMLAGRYPSEAHGSLRPRLAWDRANDRLHALPGARLLAVTNGGTIPDRGAFSAYLPDGKTRIGELDEEFVFETRVGDAFMLGSQVWRVLRITDDRVLVREAAGATPRMPFWHGDLPWRRYALGVSVGRFRRTVAERLEVLRAAVGAAGMFEALEARDHPCALDLIAWLRREHALDETSARHVLGYVAAQLDRAGTISSDRTVVVEVFDDALGDPRVVVQSPFGGRVHGPWALALAGSLRERLGTEVEALAGDDGILLRVPDSDADIPLDVVIGLGPEEARERVLRELGGSAVFGARFRQNAARALLLPGRRAGRRTPFWLQRLRAKDLLAAVRGFPEFPVVAETYRECLEDVMDMPHVEEVLEAIRTGVIEVKVVESFVPSPVAEALLRDFVHSYMYEWDAPKAEHAMQALAVSRELLGDILREVALDGLLSPRAVADVSDRMQHTAPDRRARDADELSVVLQALGDLSGAEAAERSTGDAAAWLRALQREGRVVELPMPGAGGRGSLWVSAEDEDEYRAALGIRAGGEPGSADAGPGAEVARRRILERYLRHAGPVGESDLVGRYGFPRDWLGHELDRLVDARRLARGRITPGAVGTEYADTGFLEQAHRRTMSLLREEASPVPFSTYAELQARRLHVHPLTRLSGSGGVREVMGLLRGMPLPAAVWERDVLAARVAGYEGSMLEALCDGGEVVWTASGGGPGRRARVRFFFRGEGGVVLEDAEPDVEGMGLDPPALAVLEALREGGALFLADLSAITGLPSAEAARALGKLSLSGLVTNDRLGALRRMLRGVGRVSAAEGSSGGPPRYASALEEQLARRHDRAAGGAVAADAPRPRPGLGGRPGRRAYREAKQRVGRRLAREGTAELVGRWSLVAHRGVRGPERSAEDRAEWRARVLLERHGVVNRASLEVEDRSWEWPPIRRALQLMEMRGAVRRGFFVRGLPGPQFALPDVVEQLRTNTAPDDVTAGDGLAPMVVINACDPANLYGRRARQDSASPDDTAPRAASGGPLVFARVPSTWLVQRRGFPVLVAEGGGRRITTVEGAGAEDQARAFDALLAHLRGFRTRVRVDTWDGEPALGSAGAALLRAAIAANAGFVVA